MTYAHINQESKSKLGADAVSKKQKSGTPTLQFMDNRPEAVTQRKLRTMANKSTQVSQLRAVQKVVQQHSLQPKVPIQKKTNKTGLPDHLKTGIENLSGYSMDDVKVHYNSNKPAQLQAHAYAQGTNIHIASGQEKHLPHEAWHVVQQKQGRVQPTMQLKEKVNVNDDVGLEKEADVMGDKAINYHFQQPNSLSQDSIPDRSIIQGMSFTRFQGLSRLLNWTYNDKENNLLQLEKQAEELIEAIKAYYLKSLNPQLPEGFQRLKTKLTIIKNSSLDNEEYASTKDKLNAIVQEGDRLSTKLARHDIPLEDGFDLTQEKAIPKEQYGISKENTLEQFLAIIQKTAEKEQISDLVQLRELTDIFVQYLSDAMMKFNPTLRSGVVLIKKKLLAASTDIHMAYFYASIKKDMKKAETYYILGTTSLKNLSSVLFSELSKDTQHKAYPKYREASDKPYESSAIMLASSFLKDGFVPDLVVGLPTGGVHAAHRVVAAIAIITGKKPFIWTTRPRGVKDESKDFMEGTDEEDIFTRDEKELLLSKMPNRKINIAIVDDGFVSGKTLKSARELYQKKFESSVEVDIRTGVIEAGSQQMGESFQNVPNRADYVVVPLLSMAGKTGPLDDRANDGNTKYYGPLEPKSRKQVAILSNRSSFSEMTIKEIIDGK